MTGLNAGWPYVARQAIRRSRTLVRGGWADAPAVATTVSTRRIAERARGERHVVHPAETVELPRIDGMSRWDDRAMRIRDVSVLPESAVLRVEDAIVCSRAGWVLVDGDLVEDLWSETGYPSGRLAVGHVSATATAELDGTSALLATPWLPNYYHWLFQAAPRAELVRAVADEASIDHWIVSAGGGRFVGDLLDALGIPESKRVFIAPGVHLRCRQLLAPTIPSPNRHVPSWVVAMLRRLYPSGATPENKVFIDRPESDKRRLLNRPEVEATMLAAGFTVVRTGVLSVGEQASIAASASVVAGVLGAGLSNAVFSRPGATLLELMPHNLVFPSYYKLARGAGLQYRYVVGDEPALPWPLRFPDIHADLRVPIDELERVLASIDESPVAAR